MPSPEPAAIPSDVSARTPAAVDMPRRGAARHEAIDALRGFALLGIFVINIVGLAMGITAYINPRLVGGADALNMSLWAFSAVFVEGSMRGLFSLMFGAGIILFTSRAPYPDGAVRVADLFYRRSIWLILFGLVHAYALLMPGDILFLYGVTALFLFPFRILKPARLLLAAAAMIAAMTAFAAVDEIGGLRTKEAAAEVEARQAAGQQLTSEDRQIVKRWQESLERNRPAERELRAERLARTGGVQAIYSTNAKWVAWDGLAHLFWEMLDAAAMMLIGMALIKLGVLTGTAPRQLYVRLALLGYAIGIPLRIWLAAERIAADFSPVVTWPWITYQIARVAVTLGHVGLFLMLWQMLRSSMIMRALAAAGRMAFSNYIGQTIAANLIFTGIGLGLYGTLNRAPVFAMMIAIFMLQLAFSVWWLGRYRFGPLEWMWRSLTYWKRQPMRRAARGADQRV